MWLTSPLDNPFCFNPLADAWSASVSDAAGNVYLCGADADFEWPAASEDCWDRLSGLENVEAIFRAT